MSDAEIVGAVLAALTGSGGLFAFLRWVVKEWTKIRREELAVSKEASTWRRDDNVRMVEALLAQTRSNAELAGSLERSNAILVGRIDQLTIKLETLVEWRDRTPVEGVPAVESLIRGETPSEVRRRQRDRTQTNPRGYRPPRAGGHHDPSE